MQDMASGPLQKIAQTGEQAFTKIQQAVQKLSGKADELKKSLQDVNDQLDKMEHVHVINIDDSQVKKLSKELDELHKKKKKAADEAKTGDLGGATQGTSKSKGSLSNIMKNPGDALGPGLSKLADVGLDSLIAGTKKALQEGMARQANTAALQLQLGKVGGDKVSAGLDAMAKTGVYNEEDIFSAGKQLAGSGLKADKITPAMGMMGDIAGGDGEHIKSLAQAYGGASSTGHLTEAQASMMQGAGFDPIKALSDSTGKSMPQLQAELAQGKISFDELTKSMEYATGPAGQFHGAMQSIEQSPTGQLNQFNATVNSVAGSLGETLLPVLGTVASALDALLGCTPILYALGGAIAALTVAWAAYTIATQWASVWTAILNMLALWPIVLIGIIIGLITYLIMKYDGWGKSIKALWSIIKSFVDIVIVVYKEFFQELIFGFEFVFLKIKSIFEHIAAIVTNTIKAVNLALHGDFAGAKNALTAKITTEADLQIKHAERQRAKDMAANANRVVSDVKSISEQAGNIGLSVNKNAKPGNPFQTLAASTGSPASRLAGAGSGRQMPAAGSVAPDLGVSGAAANPPSGSTPGAISGGGSKNIIVNVAKFQDKTEIHTVGLKEGIPEVEEIIRDMFLRITHSAATMAS
jgi:hypothetical protein